MALESAKDWVKHIHSNQEVGKELLNIKEGDWQTYMTIAEREGFSFSRDELDAAWKESFSIPSALNLDNVVGGTSNFSEAAVMGIRG